MPQRTIRFTIRPDGRVEETVEGFTGEACQQPPNAWRTLGNVQRREPTADAFVKQESQSWPSPPLSLMSHFNRQDRTAPLEPLVKPHELGYSRNRVVSGAWIPGPNQTADIAVPMSSVVISVFAGMSRVVLRARNRWISETDDSGGTPVQLTQRYALNTVLAATSLEGFEVAEQTVTVDGAIELVVTRWDA